MLSLELGDGAWLLEALLKLAPPLSDPAAC